MTSAEEQKKLGANPDICTIYWYLYFMFEPDDEKIAEIRQMCKKGDILCGHCKKYLNEKVAVFLTEHQKRREEAKSYVKEMFIHQPKEFTKF